MRRGSIIGPALLILIGVLFLLHNLSPKLPILEMVGQWWPVALIAWGLIRVVEITNWKMQGRPLPQNGVSGGEWTFIVVLCLAGSSLFFAHRYRDRWPQARINMHGLEILGESNEYPHAEQKLPGVGKTPRIVVENLRGNARIVGTSSDEITASGRISVRYFNQNDAEKAAKDCKLEIVRQGDLTVVRTNHERAPESAKVNSDLEITVPRGATVEARGRHGDFEVVDIDGAVNVDSDNAGVRISNVGGPVKVATRNSDIIRVVNARSPVDISGRGQDVELDTIAGEVAVSGSYHGEMTFRKLARQVRVDDRRGEFRAARIPGAVSISRGELSANDVAGPVKIKAESKDVQLTGFTDTLELSVERGDIELHPGRLPLSRMDVKTRAGNVNVVLPSAAKFEMEASTDKGEVENDLGDAFKVDSEGKGAKLTGKTGAGPEIKVHTNRGHVTVSRSGDAMAPLPPLPPAGAVAPAPAAPAPPAPPKVEKL